MRNQRMLNTQFHFIDVQLNGGPVHSLSLCHKCEMYVCRCEITQAYTVLLTLLKVKTEIQEITQSGRGIGNQDYEIKYCNLTHLEVEVCIAVM